MSAEAINALVTLAAAVGQLGIAVAAFKMAAALKGRVDNHEVRIVRLEEKPL